MPRKLTPLSFSVFRNYAGIRYNAESGSYGGKYLERKSMATVAVGLLLAQNDRNGIYFECPTEKNKAFNRRYPKFDKIAVFRHIRDELISMSPTGTVEFVRITHDEHDEYNHPVKATAKLLYIFKVRGETFGVPETIYIKIGQRDDGIIYVLSFHGSEILEE